MDQAAVTGNYKADVKAVIKVLNDVLLRVRALRYRRHYYMATGINAEGNQSRISPARESRSSSTRIGLPPGSPS